MQELDISTFLQERQNKMTSVVLTDEVLVGN